jgi:hypothetical protein
LRVAAHHRGGARRLPADDDALFVLAAEPALRVPVLGDERRGLVPAGRAEPVADRGGGDGRRFACIVSARAGSGATMAGAAKTTTAVPSARAAARARGGAAAAGPTRAAACARSCTSGSSSCSACAPAASGGAATSASSTASGSTSSDAAHPAADSSDTTTDAADAAPDAGADAAADASSDTAWASAATASGLRENEEGRGGSAIDCLVPRDDRLKCRPRCGCRLRGEA